MMDKDYAGLELSFAASIFLVPHSKTGLSILTVVGRVLFDQRVVQNDGAKEYDRAKTKS